MFVKIDSSLSVSKRNCGIPRGQYGPVRYFSLLGGIPPKLILALRPDTCFYVRIIGTKEVPPHRDHGYVTSLNLYIHSAECVTSFWLPSETSIPYAYNQTSTSNLYKHDGLEFVSSFKAEDGSAYLLNTGQIHSVSKPSDVDREFVQLTWQTRSFEDVLADLQSIQL